jgi:hypothetical protein
MVHKPDDFTGYCVSFLRVLHIGYIFIKIYKNSILRYVFTYIQKQVIDPQTNATILVTSLHIYLHNSKRKMVTVNLSGN